MSEPVARPRLTWQQRRDWLRLIRTENVGPVTFRDLINRFGSAETALAMLPELVRRGGGRRPLRVVGIDAAEAEMEAVEKSGARLVALGEPEYPRLLAQLDHAPPLVTLAGDPAVFDLPAVAIVGSRNASAAGIRMAQRLASGLGSEGYAVISGLARGIDRAAHEGSVATGTVGVLAGGINRPYPPENTGLYRKIREEGGCVITEMPFGWDARARDFPRRNRLIAGLAFGLVVVEAAFRSGSLISARLAGEMGRIVMAVPGSPLDSRAAGTNSLIRAGATLVTSAADIVEEVASQTGKPVHRRDLFSEPPDFSSVPPPADSERAQILELLGPVPTPADDLIRQTGLHPAQIQMVLLELDLAGRLERHSGGAVSLVSLEE